MAPKKWQLEMLQSNVDILKREGTRGEVMGVVNTIGGILDRKHKIDSGDRLTKR